jgi:predicted ester cyclase
MSEIERIETTQVEKNKVIVRRYSDAFNRGAFDEIAVMCTEDVQIHGVLGYGGLDVALPIWRSLHSDLGMKLEIVDLCGEGDAVIARFVETGVFQGPFQGKKPTGKPYKITAMEWFEFRDGKIAKRWGARDLAAIMRQTGMEMS